MKKLIRDVIVKTPLELSEEVIKNIADNCVGNSIVFDHNGVTTKGVVESARVIKGVIYVDVEV